MSEPLRAAEEFEHNSQFPNDPSGTYESGNMRTVEVFKGRHVVASYVYAPPPDEDDFLPDPPKLRSPFQIWPARRMAIPVVIFALCIVAVSLGGWAFGNFNLSASARDIVQHGEVWRLGTALFAHGDLGHLASNLLPFLFFGWLLHSYFGLAAFPVLPIGIGIMSNFMTVSMYNSNAHLLGASGMIYGMIGLWLVLYLKFDTRVIFSRRLLRAAGFAMLMLLPRAYEPTTSYLAHASGFSIGIATGVIGVPFFRVHNPKTGV